MNELAKILIAEGHKLTDSSNEKIDLRVFNELKHDLLPRFLGQDTHHSSRFISFMLINVLDDISYNLTVDFPYKEPYGLEVHEKKVTFFKWIGKRIVDIGTSMQDNSLHTAVACFSEMINTYLNLTDEINDIIERSSNA